MPARNQQQQEQRRQRRRKLQRYRANREELPTGGTFVMTSRHTKDILAEIMQKMDSLEDEVKELRTIVNNHDNSIFGTEDNGNNNYSIFGTTDDDGID